MGFITVTVTIDDRTGLDGRDIGSLIERHVKHQTNPAIEVTATPTSVDVRPEKNFTDIELSPEFMMKIKKGMRGKVRGEHLTTDQLEHILLSGAKRYGL